MKLKEWRKKEGLTQRELSAKLGVHENSVIRYEAENPRCPLSRSFEKIMEITQNQVSRSTFLGWRMMHDINMLNANFAPKTKSRKKKRKQNQKKTGVEPPNYCNKNGAILAAQQIMDFWKEKDTRMSVAAIPLSSPSKGLCRPPTSGPPIATLDTRRPEKIDPRRAKY